MESRILDFPDPLSPVIALKWGSNLWINNDNRTGEFEQNQGEFNDEL